MKNIVSLSEISKIRQKAEELLSEKRSEVISQFSESEIMKIIHELEVHQIELELQNEELLLARTEAQEAAEKYTELYDFAPLGYFTLSPKSQILKLNLCGAQILGKDRSRLINSLFASSVSDDTKPVFNYFLERIFGHHEKETCEVTLKINGDPPRYVHLTGIMTGNESQCFVNAIDITERKQAIEVIIENQRLGAIGEMASSIAHDFNNSLQSISGNLELAMISTEIPTTTIQYLRTIKTAVDDAAERVQLLQRFGEKKQNKSQYSYVALNTLIEEVVKQTRPLWKDDAEMKGLSIDVKTHYGELPEIFCNHGELRTAIFNILKNSIEAMPEGGEILIETEYRLEGASISITDTGIGMNEETRTRIFQPFYTTKGFDIGRGLGMSGVLTIIKEHGGTIQVKKTSPGKGTTIESIIPFSQRKEPERKEIERLPSGNTVRVLWVEDEESIRIIASEMVKILGHQVDVASSGKEALDLLNLNTYDLVVTDLGMPEMNGWQLADIIKEKFDNHMKVAIASGWGNQKSEAEKIEHGVRYNLNKPFGIAQLQKLLEEVAQLTLVE